MLRVLRKADRVGQFVGHFIDGDVNPDAGKRSQSLRIKARDGMSRQAELPHGASASGNTQYVIDEVELDLEMLIAIRNRRG
jgi:hypothetical protein